jgi:arabinofuranosyltransferase
MTDLIVQTRAIREDVARSVLVVAIGLMTNREALPRWGTVLATYAVPAVVAALGCVIAIRTSYCTWDYTGHARGSDDAFISFQYSRNLVAGHGLVFNPGERVEGYSNLSYVLLMALSFVLGIDAYRFSMVVNTALTVASVVVFVHFARARFSVVTSLVLGLLVAICPSLWLWSASGLETPLILLLQTLLWVYVDRSESSETASLVVPSVVSTLLVVSRADGFVMPVVAVVYLVLKGRARLAIAIGAVTAVTLGVLVMWRLHYYGQPLPNTYYAKVTSGVFQRVTSALKLLLLIGSREGTGAYLLLLAASVVRSFVEAGPSMRELLARVRFGHFFCCAWLSYWLYIGGDNFDDRFLISLVPIALYTAATTFSTTGPSALLAASLLALTQLSVPLRDLRYRKPLVGAYDRWITLGEVLGRHFPGRLLAIGAAGKVTYYSRLRTIDMLGLNDYAIAHSPTAGSFVAGHNKYDPDYVMRQKPDLIAGWLTLPSLDLDAPPARGFSLARYTAAGYRPRFLANVYPKSRYGDVIDVGNCSLAQIRLIASQNFWYVVLVTAELASSPPPPSCPNALLE